MAMASWKASGTTETEKASITPRSSPATTAPSELPRPPRMATDAVSETAPAKLNLCLHVTGRRIDGYHLLDSLVVFADVADRIAVMYAGRIVEHADVHDLYAVQGHPYTKGLLESIPRLDHKGHQLTTIKGLPPNLMRIPSGCPFHPRCPYRKDPVCSTDVPDNHVLAGARTARCHFAEEVIGGNAVTTN